MHISSLERAKKIKPDMKGAKGFSKQVPISSEDGAPTFSFRVFTIEPGGHTPLHEHPFEHLNYIIEGHGAVFLEDGLSHPPAKPYFATSLALKSGHEWSPSITCQSGIATTFNHPTHTAALSSGRHLRSEPPVYRQKATSLLGKSRDHSSRIPIRREFNSANHCWLLLPLRRPPLKLRRVQVVDITALEALLVPAVLVSLNEDIGPTTGTGF